jgi:hypothetical protein
MFWWLSGSYHREGRQLMEQVLARSDELSPCGAARALASRGLIAFWQADYSGAVPDLTAALERFRQEGDDQGTGYTLSALALIEPCSSAGASGEEKLREAQRLIVATGDEWGAMLATNGLLWGLQATGRLPESDEEYRSALAEAEALGSPHELGMAHANIGRYRLYRQEGEAALPHLEEWLDQLEQLSQKGTLPSAFEAIAEASDLLGDPERATRLFAAASALRREIAAPARATAKERLDMNVGRLQAQLGESEFRAAWTEGECLTLEDALSAARVAPAELRL